jgi:hypothetical protein
MDFLDTEIRTDLQQTMEHHYSELCKLESAIEKMKAVQKLAPMFASALNTLEQLRQTSAVNFTSARRDYCEAVLLPLLDVAVPNATYTALYGTMRAWNISPEAAAGYKRDTEALDNTEGITEPHLITSVNDGWRGGERGRESRYAKSWTTIYDETPRNLVQLEDWLRKDIVRAAASKVASAQRNRERNERKKVYEAWRREREKATGEPLPNFGRAAQAFFLDYPGKSYQRPKANIEQPPAGIPLT